MPFGGYLFLANYRMEGFDSLTEKNSPFFPPEKKMELMSCLIIDMYAGK